MIYRCLHTDKVCKECGQLKPIDDFPVARVYKGTGVITKRTVCKICYNEYCKKVRLVRKDKIKIYNQCETAKKARKKYKETHRKEARQYQIDNWDHIKELSRINSKTEKARKNKREYARRRYWENENLRLYSNLKRRTMLALNGEVRVGKDIFELWGCDIDFLKGHLVSQFTEGMTWGNRSFTGWHIDHIIPCCAFNFKIASHQRACFHYTNLRPMWGKPNISKGGNYSQDDFNKHLDAFK